MVSLLKTQCKIHMEMHTTAELNPENGWSQAKLLFELSIHLQGGGCKCSTPPGLPCECQKHTGKLAILGSLGEQSDQR